MRTIVCLICILSFGELLAQPALKSTESDAHGAFEAGQYTLALYHYNRLAFDLLPQTEARVQLQIGRCHMSTGNFQRAAAFFDQAFFAAGEDSLKIEAALYKIRALVAEQQFALALSELLSLNTQLTNLQHQWSYQFYLGLCHYQMANFDAARNHWLACTTDSAALVKAFLPVKKFNRPNSTTAMIMSAIIPGSGQLYAAEYREAANSFIINGFFLYYGFRVASRLSTLDAVISVMPWFQRYHAGGYNKASVLAYNRMLERRKLYLEEIFNIIEAQPSR